MVENLELNTLQSIQRKVIQEVKRHKFYCEALAKSLKQNFFDIVV